jgi:protein-disulfide isomerase
MSDKKLIIFSLAIAALLIFGGWYYSKNGSQQAAILPSEDGQTTITEKGIVIGNPDAPVTMEEYTEFLCPACARFANQTLPQIKEDYVKTGKVKLVIYVFPPFELGNAALCANEQGKFSEFHDYIFQHQQEISNEEDIKNYAINSGLNAQEFTACYAQDKFKNKLNAWYNEGGKRGVTATPTFFINGQQFVGAYPYADFKKIIDEKLAETK